MCIYLEVTFIHPFYSIVESYWPLYIWWNYFQWDYLTNLYQHHLLYCLSPGALNFFFFVVVGRDVRGGSPKWPGAFVFRGGYHPRKTSCKSTVGANRLAGPIMSWTDHYFSVNDSPICIWPKMRTSGAAFFAFLTHIYYRPNHTCQLATVTVRRPSRVNVQETNNSLCPWSCWSFSH